MNLSVNAMFFDDKTMHILYIDYGVFNFINNILQIIYSALNSSIITILLKNLALTQYNIIKLKRKNKTQLKNELANTTKCLKLKLSLFFYVGLLILLFFWYFVALFCIVYRNTQIIFLKDFLYSFLLSSIYPFGYNLLPAIFRIYSLHDKKKSSKCLYQTSIFLSLI